MSSQDVQWWWCGGCKSWRRYRWLEGERWQWVHEPPAWALQHTPQSRPAPAPPATVAATRDAVGDAASGDAHARDDDEIARLESIISQLVCEKAILESKLESARTDERQVRHWRRKLDHISSQMGHGFISDSDFEENRR